MRVSYAGKLFCFNFGKGENKPTENPKKLPSKKERWKADLPEIGTVFYIPIEHHYYNEDGMSRPEYLINESMVIGYSRGGYIEIKLSDGKTPRFFKKNDVEKRIFKNRVDALAYAEQLADQYDCIWEKFEGKMRREWRNEA